MNNPLRLCDPSLRLHTERMGKFLTSEKSESCSLLRSRTRVEVDLGSDGSSWSRAGLGVCLLWLQLQTWSHSCALTERSDSGSSCSASLRSCNPIQVCPGATAGTGTRAQDAQERPETPPSTTDTGICLLSFLLNIHLFLFISIFFLIYAIGLWVTEFLIIIIYNNNHHHHHNNNNNNNKSIWSVDTIHYYLH